MSKAYSKPDIVFEDFSLSTSIANCDIDTRTSHQWDCYLTIGSMKVFSTSVIGCKTSADIVVPEDEFAGICYHIPYNGMRAFNS